MPDHGPCPPGKYITHPAECARAADEHGMEHRRDPLGYWKRKDPRRIPWAIGEFSTKIRRGCITGDNFAGAGGRLVAIFNRFGGLFYFHFLIGQVWWTFLFLFFIGQVGWTTGRQTLSKYLQMLTEEIQKENIKYIYKIPSQIEV